MSRTLFSLAGFQVIISGRFWVIAEDRATRDNHHYRVIQSLEFTTAPDRRVIDTFDGFRKKRNISSYDLAGSVSDKEAGEMLKLAISLRGDVERWIRATRPELLKPAI